MHDTISTRLPLASGLFTMKVFCDPHDHKEHVILVRGDVRQQENVLVRIHSECLTGDVFGSLRCDCGPQLQNAIAQIAKAEAGVLIYLRQEGRGIGLIEKLKAYQLQDAGHDTVEANLLLGHQADERSYSIVPEILRSLEIKSINLITNNPTKLKAIEEAGFPVTRIASPLVINAENANYLRSKALKMQHMIPERDLEAFNPT